MFGEDQIAEQLSAARDTLAQGPGTAGAQTEPILTEAADGRIKVTLGTDGRFEQIKMTLSALKDGPEALLEQLTLALNTAIDLRGEQTAVPVPTADLGEMNERVAQMQDASIQQFKDMDASVRELMARLYGGR
ncbi:MULTISPECIES: hypothetical protein [Glycomyces]|uniref:YbaB/EbfC DNA-binding family protein n=1 Tax=Glycomyces artemisiae TaxID=1076443 RepID=A0A2T0UWX6_9ACTN|nr:hypothetical protein [Glycomyces artemisiae]PRY62347.1 hypothetical protein B0I28_101675 [Glycomyces artemisiae]